MIWHVEFLHSSLGLWLAYKETVGGTKCLQKLAGTPVLLLESFRSMFGVSTADCSWQFQVRSKKSQDFWFWMSTSVFTWKKSTSVLPSGITERKGVLHFKYKVWLKVWFYSIPNRLVKKKRLLLTYIFTGHTGKILNRKKKSAEGVDLPKTTLPKVQTWTANCKRDHWSQVRLLLVICGHMYSGTNMDLKLSNGYGTLCWCVPLIKTLV